MDFSTSRPSPPANLDEDLGDIDLALDLEPEPTFSIFDCVIVAVRSLILIVTFVAIVAVICLSVQNNNTNPLAYVAYIYVMLLDASDAFFRAQSIRRRKQHLVAPGLIFLDAIALGLLVAAYIFFGHNRFGGRDGLEDSSSDDGLEYVVMVLSLIIASMHLLMLFSLDSIDCYRYIKRRKQPRRSRHIF